MKLFLLLASSFTIFSTGFAAPPPPCQKDLADLTVYVDSVRGTPSGAGSSTSPLKTFAQAIALAKQNRHCGVQLQLAAGEYRESLVLSLRVKIVGVNSTTVKIFGSILNRGYSLRLQNLTIGDVAGAVIQQNGGSLRLSNVIVSKARLQAGNLLSGAGLLLDGGAQAVISWSQFLNNEGMAVRASGAGTKIWLEAVIVNDTGYNPAAVSAAQPDGTYLGAVQIRERAEAYGHILALKDNSFVGLHVSNSAKARISGAKINGTKVGRFGSRDFGGMNFAVLDGASVELDRPESRKAAFVGFSNQRSALKTNGGFVTESPIGIALRGPYPVGTTPFLCLNTLSVQVVDTPLDSDELPLPCSGAACTPSCHDIAMLPVPADS